MFIAISFLMLSVSAPIAIAINSSTPLTSSPVSWEPDPEGRGTFSLIFSCLLTLGLCVWSAMHLNIPPHDESLVQSYMRNLKWGLIGVFGPELVVFAAWRQYNSAEALKAEVNRQINV